MKSTKPRLVGLTSEAEKRLAYFEQRRNGMVSTIQQLVELESPSDDKAAIDRVAGVIAVKFSQLDGAVRVHEAKNFGNHLQVDFPGKSVPGKSPSAESDSKLVLLLGHYDTVYPLGTLDTMPCRVRGDRLTGPGVL